MKPLSRVALTLIASSLVSLGPSLAHAAGVAVGQRNKVLILGLDGVYPPALERAQTPNLNRLIENGCYTPTAMGGDITVSGPGWSSILCGVWRDKHGVPDNDFRRPNYNEYPSLFTLSKRARPELKAAAFVSWLPLARYVIFDDAVDHKAAHDSENGGDDLLVSEAVEYLSTADVDLVFFYFADIDTAGHAHGFHPNVPEYLAEIEAVDAQIGELLEAIRSRPDAANENWLIIATTDHGGTLDGTHGRDELKHREIFMLVSGADAARGRMMYTVNQVDVAPTALRHLGVRIDPAWNLDGRPVGSPLRTHLGRNLIFNGAADAQRGGSSAADDIGIAGWRDLGGMTALAYGCAEGYPAADTPGPDDRAENFFAGGAEGDSTISQRIDISDLGDMIDQKLITFNFSAWLGGYAAQRDMMSATARFLDARGGEVGRAALSPVTRQDREREFDAREAPGAQGADQDEGQGQGEGDSAALLTGFIHRISTGAVPPGTRMVEIVLLAEVGEGGNDGYADNVSFTLTRE